MKCDKCKTEDATVHVKQMVGKQIFAVNLCGQCAGQAGLGDLEDGQLTLVAILQAIAKNALTAKPSTATASTPSADTGAAKLRCAACGLAFDEFAAAGLLGCAACYQAFAEPLRNTIRGLHRDHVHRGRTPGGRDGRPASLAPTTLARLEAELGRAVDCEDYEEAARLRDDIAQLKGAIAREATR